MVRPTVTQQVLTSGPKEIKGHTGYLSFAILMWFIGRLNKLLTVEPKGTEIEYFFLEWIQMGEN